MWILHISTHSLTRRLTCHHPIMPIRRLNISTHSLTRRLTWQAGRCHGILRISTHSLTRRLTLLIAHLKFDFDFNSQPHKEADCCHIWYHSEHIYFNSQPHKEADERFYQLFPPHQYFNSQPHKEADKSTTPFYSCQHISTHSLTRRLTRSVLKSANSGDYFNSQPHKEADYSSFASSIVSLLISTHSLTRRLTNIDSKKLLHTFISTHSLTRRLTLLTSLTKLSISFQLTASQGGWPLHSQLTGLVLFISTHSLTRRLTLQVSWFRCRCNISTHSLTRRLTIISQDYHTRRTFQLTASQGGWRHRGQSALQCDSISTHSLTRRLTHHATFQFRSQRISTHSLTRRLTWCFVFICNNIHISTHSLTRRLTKKYTTKRTGKKHFNSQPHKEADCGLYLWIYIFKYFNSQPHKEADAFPFSAYFPAFTFQLTASQGGWPLPGKCCICLLHISTHSLTRRLTHFCRYSEGNTRISTHSLTRRLTNDQRKEWLRNYISTHSLTRRLTFPCSCPRMFEIFQLTASQGGWPVAYLSSSSKRYISTHSLTRRLTAAVQTKLCNQSLFQLTASQGGWPCTFHVILP